MLRGLGQLPIKYFNPMNEKKWIKIALTLLGLLVLIWFTPNEAVDPWNLLIPKKMLSMVFALVAIQGLGILLISRYGSFMGSILTGFLGGLISSTATTAALAKKNSLATQAHIRNDSLVFLSTTIAMLVEGLGIVFVGIDALNYRLAALFCAPALVTILIISLMFKKSTQPKRPAIEPSEFKIAPLLKLSIFIIAILALSKILQHVFGSQGLINLTFLVSLFEIHGSLIANTQLLKSGAINEPLLSTLISLSILASYLSKLFLIFTLGNKKLFKYVSAFTFLILSSLGLTWFLIY